MTETSKVAPALKKLTPSARRAIKTAHIARRLAYGYLTAGIVLLSALALKVPDLNAWLWLSLLTIMPLIISLRSALVWVYRKNRSQLNWWLRPAGITEREFDTTWLFYAVLFGAFSLVGFLF